MSYYPNKVFKSDISSFEQLHSFGPSNQKNDYNFEKRKKEQEIDQLQKQLNNLILQVNSLENQLSTEENDFSLQKQFLLSKINKIKIESEMKRTKIRMNHLKELNLIQQQHSETILQRTSYLSTTMQHSFNQDKNSSVINNIHNTKTSAAIKESQNTLERTNQILNHQKLTQILNESSSSKKEPEENLQIKKLEEEKKHLIDECKKEEKMNQKKIQTLIETIQEQDASFKTQIELLKKEARINEDKYNNTVNLLLFQLENIQKKRSFEVNQKRNNIKHLQKKMKELENNYRDRTKDAFREAEKLKTAIFHANMKKEQQLVMERESAIEKQQLAEQNLELQEEVAKLTKALQLNDDKNNSCFIWN